MKRRRRGRRVGLVLLVACALLLLVAPASRAVVIGFDDQAPGAVLDEQYAALGVHFGPSPFLGTSGKLSAVERLTQARSGPNVAALAYDLGTDFSSSWIRFDKPQRKVTFYACRTGGGGDPPQPNVNVDAYDSAGLQIDNQQGIPCTLNGALVPVTVERPGIAYVNVGGTGGAAAPGDGWAIDDLEFELDPPPPPLPPPATPATPVKPPDAEPAEPVGICADPLLAPRLIGTAAVDSMIGTAARDTLSGLGGADCIAGRSGGDRLTGGSGSDRVYGESGADRVSGGGGADQLRGGSGGDDLIGGSGHDQLNGSGGSDRFSARDGQRDQIRCGSGRDSVTADRDDRVSRDCERVRRR